MIWFVAAPSSVTQPISLQLERRTAQSYTGTCKHGIEPKMRRATGGSLEVLGGGGRLNVELAGFRRCVIASSSR